MIPNDFTAAGGGEQCRPAAGAKRFFKTADGLKISLRLSCRIFVPVFKGPPTLWVRLVFRGCFQSVPMLCSFFVISVLFSIAEFCSDAMKKNFEKIMNFYEVNFRHLSFYVRIEKKKENH